MSKKNWRLVTYFLIVLAVFALIVIIKFVISDNIAILPKKILYLTKPMNIFTGRIDAINDNYILLSYNATLLPYLFPDEPTYFAPEYPIVKVAYKVTVTPDIKIERPQPVIKYLFKDDSPATLAKLKLNDLKEGDQITVFTDTDLRFLFSDTFRAKRIKIFTVANSIEGMIADIKGKQLMVTAPVPILDQTIPKRDLIYTVSINNDTEISNLVNNNPQKYSLSYLQKGMQIGVYANEDTTITQQLTALRIEPK